MRIWSALTLIPVVLLCSLPALAGGPGAQDSSRVSARYPMGPDDELTPGSFCSTPSSYRYAERIAWCRRDVSTDVKRAVMVTYDNQLGFQVTLMNRQDFKIDHYIPLCMGGSNKTDNLWPQHKSVYAATDPIEQRLCELVASGEMRQAEAVGLVRQAKADLDEARRLTARYSRTR
jgi:hypothetical protein